jgi:hypothetical protein
MLPQLPLNARFRFHIADSFLRGENPFRLPQDDEQPSLNAIAFHACSRSKKTASSLTKVLRYSSLARLGIQASWRFTFDRLSRPSGVRPGRSFEDRAGEICGFIRAAGSFVYGAHRNPRVYPLLDRFRRLNAYLTIAAEESSPSMFIAFPS